MLLNKKGIPRVQYFTATLSPTHTSWEAPKIRQGIQTLINSETSVKKNKKHNNKTKAKQIIIKKKHTKNSNPNQGQVFITVNLIKFGGANKN